MNHTLDQFTDNPIIDELVCWPPRAQAVSSIRASAPMFRKPFIEVTLHDGAVFSVSFARENFAHYWTEAKIILETLTAIELVSEFRTAEYQGRNELVAEVLEEKADSLAGAEMMFNNGMYQQYLWQFGNDYKALPEEVLGKLALAKSQLTADR